ncbi:chitinase [Longimycelium tulufanense]|uniref:Chitinase n=1 Tax=Longimycelium tulufanense TaxID=907463 RepID=A0A8J3C622_9PSEU|nr:glycosyl hydrolase family 18 protein [Longimycelium tulufanense]GGM36841.1 chitinase [Longimycelium tulufanense]
MTRRVIPLLSLLGLLAGLLVVGATGRSQAAHHEQCRPDGLYRTPGVAVPYCDIYDTEGRERMSSARRVIGYFTGWRHGKNGQPAYLVNNVPWNKLTHINYAFAHVGPDNEVSVGTTNPNNPATGMEWPTVPGAEMDPSLPFKGHFNLLNKFKKQHPDVKTLISVGGWAETGGYLDDNGDRVASGGFYSMTTNANNSVNTAGINTFADSVVSFLRTYGFDGVDIDYEYPTSMKDAGNPLDWNIANPRRAGLMRSYVELMKTLREKLDAASATDGRYYMLTVAAPSSGYLLRGMEHFQVFQYLDYINIMSYDLHGAWNEFVGPNAALYDDGNDAELKHWNVYDTPQYGGIGYLNTDWAAHYFRGGVQAGRINIGLPYYTRGWRNVTGGTNGLWGEAVGSECPNGLATCGDGARGIDNIWHDIEDGTEVGAGSNPMWHAKNLERGIAGSYLRSYGLDPDNDPEDRLTGTYARHYDTTLVAPWLWNNDKKVFLSTEDEQSLATKVEYVVDTGLGGVMFWELAGDFAWDDGRGEYFMGSTLTTRLYDSFRTATPYNTRRANRTMPYDTLDVRFELTGFALGDNNYPISPKLRITNNSQQTLPGGTEIQFDYPTAAPANMAQQSGWSLSVISSDHTGPNRGGLKGDFHRVALRLPNWQTLAPGQSTEVQLTYYLPISGPANYTVSSGGRTYAVQQDLGRQTAGGTPTNTTTPTSTTATTTATTTTTPPPVCHAPAWDRTEVYTAGDTVSHKSHAWRAKWWTQGEEPGTTDEWGVWEDLGPC